MCWQFYFKFFEGSAFGYILDNIWTETDKVVYYLFLIEKEGTYEIL